MLEIRGLVKVYPGPVAALQGVDLDIPLGMFGLLGPNGAGKSTFMKILAGLLEPTSGSVTLDGKDVIADPQWLRARLGYLPQEFGFYPHLSGEAMLLHLLELKGVVAPGGAKKLARDLLERVNLSFAARRPVKSYSGGRSKSSCRSASGRRIRRTVTATSPSRARARWGSVSSSTAGAGTAASFPWRSA